MAVDSFLYLLTYSFLSVDLIFFCRCSKNVHLKMIVWINFVHFCHKQHFKILSWSISSCVRETGRSWTYKWMMVWVDRIPRCEQLLLLQIWGHDTENTEVQLQYFFFWKGPINEIYKLLFIFNYHFENWK